MMKNSLKFNNLIAKLKKYSDKSNLKEKDEVKMMTFIFNLSNLIKESKDEFVFVNNGIRKTGFPEGEYRLVGLSQNEQEICDTLIFSKNGSIFNIPFMLLLACFTADAFVLDVDKDKDIYAVIVDGKVYIP